MAAIRHTLQRDVFQVEEQRLVSFLHITKPGRKKHGTFLCLTISQDPPISAHLYEVKKVDAAKVASESHKIKRKWPLKDLRVVDGKNPRKAIPELELQLERTYLWEATNVKDKEPFIRQLWKISDKYLHTQKPEFVNVSLPVDDLELTSSGFIPTASSSTRNHHDTAAAGSHDGVEEGGVDLENYQPISGKEEADLRKLLSKCNLTLADAHKFSDVLTKQLTMLDGANLDSLLRNEADIMALMNAMDKAIERAEELEGRLDKYDQVLANVRESVELMEEKDSLNFTFINNRNRLYNELDTFVKAIHIPREHYRTLEEAKLTDLQSISRCTLAAQEVFKALNPKISPGLQDTKAYREQSKQCEALVESFAEKLVAHVSALFNRFSELEASEGFSEPGTLSPHSQVHQGLMPFAELIMWLKAAHSQGCKILLQRYIFAFKDVYAKALGGFFAFVTRSSGVMQQQQQGSFERKHSMKRIQSGGELALPQTPDNLVVSTDPDTRARLATLVTLIVKQLEPVLGAERKFCAKFFQMSAVSMVPDNVSTGSGDSGKGVGGVSPEKRLERKMHDEMRSVMAQLFFKLDEELLNFVALCEGANPAYIMILLGTLWQQVVAMEDSNSYLSAILGKVVVIVKRKFDGFMETQIGALQAQRLSKRTKPGILPFVSRLKVLISEAENAFETTTRRHDVERWYGSLISAVFAAIERIAQDPNCKSPAPVLRMENYHRVFSILSQLKVPCLDTAKKDAKVKYQEALQDYVVQFMGKPMEKLSNFFDNIEHSIQQGLKPEDVAYQLRYSRSELESLLRSYPAKEVGKGLQSLYEKVDKHLSEDENLFQVVWHKMQEEFINQYKHYQSLIAQCYPTLGLGFDFDINDILKYFSDIAQQH